MDLEVRGAQSIYGLFKLFKRVSEVSVGRPCAVKLACFSLCFKVQKDDVDIAINIGDDELLNLLVEHPKEAGDLIIPVVEVGEHVEQVQLQIELLLDALLEALLSNSIIERCSSSCSSWCCLTHSLDEVFILLPLLEEGLNPGSCAGEHVWDVILVVKYQVLEWFDVLCSNHFLHEDLNALGLESWPSYVGSLAHFTTSFVHALDAAFRVWLASIENPFVQQVTKLNFASGIEQLVLIKGIDCSLEDYELVHVPVEARELL